MKKILALLLVAVMLFSAAACTQSAAPASEAPKAEEPAKATDAPKAEEPKATEVPAAEPGYTDGVWLCSADATHFVLLKLKEDGTFYARGLMGTQGFFGKYEIVDMAVEYYDAKGDGILKQEDMPFDVLKSEKAVKFMHEDGTPYEVRQEPASVKIDGNPTPIDAINEGLGKEYVALAGEVLHHVAFDDYSRSLTHKPNEKFSEADEIRNLLYKFMVAEVSEKNAADGWKQQELTLELYHNGYVDMATGDELVDEAYQKIEGNVYTLADGATVTVDPDAYTAVYQKGDVKIDFVKFNENGSDAAAPAVKAQYEGEAFSGKVKLVAKLFEDGTIVIYGNDKELSKGTYEGQGLPTITLDKGTAKIKATSATDVKLVFTADLGNGQESDYELAKVEVTAEAPAAAPAAVAQYEGEAFSGKVKLVAKMFDDKTIVIYANDKEFSKGTYEGQGLPTITLDKGTAKIKATSATDVKLVFTADLGNGQESDYELAKVEVTVEAPAAAEPAVKAQYEGEAFSGKVKLVAKMFDNGTIVIYGNDTELTRGTYEGQGLPTITLDKGTAQIKATSATDVKLILNIDLGNGTAADYTLERVNN